MLTCLGVIIFQLYILGRFFGLGSACIAILLYPPSMIALLGFILCLQAIKGVKKNKSWANKWVLFLTIVCMLGLIVIFFYIKAEERLYSYRKQYHFSYFQLYLFMAIPMAISSILSFISFIKTKPTKENLPN